MLTLDSVVDEVGQAIAPAQVFFSGSRIGRRFTRELNFFIRPQLEPQSLNDALHDRVLHSDDVACVRIDSLAPENLAGPNVEQLCCDSQTISGAKKRRRENRINAEIASGFRGVNNFVLIL